MRKCLTIMAVLALAPFALAACGGDEEEGENEIGTPTTEDVGGGGGGGGETVAVSAAADGSLAFEETSLDAAAGPTTFEFDNPASLSHDFCLEGDSGDLGCSDTISADTATLDVDLEPGEYTYYCSVAGHRESGMEGTLTVE